VRHEVVDLAVLRTSEKPTAPAVLPAVSYRLEDDWFDYKLEHDPRFLDRIARVRKSLDEGKGILLEDVPRESKAVSRRTKHGS
jgi:hypothetical protein